LQMHNATIGATRARREYATTRKEAADCRRCELWERATQTVFGEGPVPAPLMLVGEQPGDKEDLEGHPFVGPAGRILGEALELAGIDREAAFVTNVVKHFRWRPSPNGKRRLHEKPTKANVTACHVWVEKELEIVRPEVLVAMGATAVDALLGKGVAVMRDRGKPIASELATTVLVTIHPSAVLRARDDRDEMFEGFVRDLRVAAKALQAER
jgi:uracil-DNA glycosylase family protein